MNCKSVKGTVSLYSISVLKGDGKPKKESVALICNIKPNKPFYMDLNSFRPDPRDILEKKKRYKVDISLCYEPQIYLDDLSTMPVLKKISSDNFVFVNIR